SATEVERGRTAAAAGEVPADVERVLGDLSLSERADHAIDYWIGMTRGDQGLTHVSLAWMPRPSGSSGGEMSLTIQATSPDGKSYFSSSATTTRQLSFDAPVGEMVLKIKALDARGEEIDNSNRRITVPGF